MSILISGASIAGLAAAQRLSARGAEVTVVERAPGLRRNGAPIDVRGEALDVAADMGIRDTLAAHETGAAQRSAFTHIVDENGEKVGALPTELPQDSADDLEIFRNDLIDILHGSVGPDVTFVYGDSIQELTDTGEAVEVGFTSGRAGRYELVVGADGIHSHTRRLVFGPEERYRRHLGVYYGILSLPAELDVDGEAYLYSVPGRSVILSGYGERTNGGFTFLSPEITYDYHDIEQQRQLVFDAYSSVRGWKVAEMLDALKQSEDFYLDSTSQVHMDRWSRGRVVLLGDAAFAPSFYSGQGTPLAMIGADVLATEWATCDGDLDLAFARYEEAMRPRVHRAQKGVPEARDRVNPPTWEAIEARNQQWPPVR
ncbi:FAD-dependent monooxygenase [Streptomyces iconiensis]|uniref:FAD-dependent monooxygenase n=1 Tax=Streptomyces iconiensis TaxID=1384038 RepID=A0ABT7A363_9ACTN|nr:FAD-dependent monooxygenase [Streptomyces iconiensis]MDJ1135768.1 FAD-dependent monooxygenase [Streptomyces iconiensis]